jgi:hypothetical protein
LEVGADGCELNDGRDAEARNLSVGGGGMAAEVRIQAYV